ncbi:hypothetical protein EUTSA_v10022505mg [Eutrema salsugineum]|uniref:Uncharacterized protein n=1 Tax=Eutrema salsugineum TaxID=72664 RepID=V4LGB8_EUTSA|nr:hypothetical protein EUTSA_v10022505mg [Eutrema salsugineum]
MFKSWQRYQQNIIDHKKKYELFKIHESLEIYTSISFNRNAMEANLKIKSASQSRKKQEIDQIKRDKLYQRRKDRNGQGDDEFDQPEVLNSVVELAIMNDR